MEYTVDNNALRLSKENVHDDTNLIIHVTNRHGVIQEEFPIMAGGKFDTSTFQTQNTTTYSSTYPSSHNPYVYSE